jgi:hypothetical protein
MKSPQLILNTLSLTPKIILPLVREAPTHLLKRRPEPGAWSIHEHACHLANVHSLFFSRLELILNEEHPTIQPYFPDVDDAPDALLNMDLTQALERFSNDRRTLIARLRILTPLDWERTAEHGEYSHYSIAIMFRHLALHDMAHAYEIEALLLKKEWA